ncbi:hypothetical protein FGRMN_1782 [Fusarium graminum]|nr:hypothetical protein FGRMN_1782 [Fusarium graminum]
MSAPTPTFVNKLYSAPPALAFISIGLVQGIIVTILQGVVVLKWQAFLKPTVMQVPAGYTVPTNFAVFLFGFLFQLVFMCDAIRLRSTAQAMLACVLNAGFLPLAVLQRHDIKNAEEQLRGSTDMNGDHLVYLDRHPWDDYGDILFALPIIVAICTLLLVISVWYLKKFFSWQSYRNVSADAKLRRMRIIYQIFVMLAKMVMYFIICFEVVYGVTQLQARGTEFIIRMILLGVAVVNICLSIVWCKSENRIGMIVSICIYLAGMAYLVYMLVSIQIRWRYYSTTFEILTSYASMAIVFILITTIFAIICLRNFWSGLKEHLGKHEEAWDQNARSKDLELETKDGFQYESLGSKLDLDG